MSKNWSKYQIEVFSSFEGDRRNKIIEAVAGSGKSTTVKKVYRDNKRGVDSVILAFNHQIANELRIDGINALTLNSLGSRALRSKVRMDGSPDTKKTRNLIKRLLSKAEIKEMASGVLKMVTMAKTIGMVPRHPLLSNMDLISFTEDTDRNWFDLIRKYRIYFETEAQDRSVVDRAIAAARTVLANSITYGVNGVIDFDDQKYLTAILGIPTATYRSVYLDEAQDLNFIDRVLVRKSLGQHGRLGAVGDRCQAIYGWRGADMYSMDRIEEEFDCDPLELSICYRCPTSVVDMAKQWVPQIEAADGAPEGLIDYPEEIDPSLFIPGSLVLCRTNAPLIRLAYWMIARRIKLEFAGRDIAQPLTDLLNLFRIGYVNSGETMNEMDYVTIQLESWRERETHKAVLREDEEQVAAINDLYDCMDVVIKNSQVNSIYSLIGEVSSLFSTSGHVRHESVTLSSMHRSKGSEAERVIILDFEMMPMQSAKTDEEIQQEHNLMYVAVTRAQRELFFITSDQF